MKEAVTLAKRHGLTFVASVAVHGLATALLVSGLGPGPFAQATPQAVPETGAPAATAVLNGPWVGEGVSLVEAPADWASVPPLLTGGEAVARPDTARRGRGGDADVRVPALNLAETDDRVRLSPDLPSRLDRDQMQRLRAGSVRSSWEDRRSTTHPAELTFVVTGPGTLRERRPIALEDPDRGALRSPRAALAGALLGSPDRPNESAEVQAQAGGAMRGTAEQAPGVGLRGVRVGQDQRASAVIGSARPAVVAGPVAVAAAVQARPQDDVDSEQEVATTVRSLVHSSTAGGLKGEGQGGSGGGGASGSGGGPEAGSIARPMGTGQGVVFDYWPSDPRIRLYYRRLHARLDPLWSFPKAAALDLRQGTVIIDFTVFADGRVAVAWPPVRPSGVDEFDRMCADAIRRAAPFEPLPPELGLTQLTIRAPFDAHNPIIK